MFGINNYVRACMRLKIVQKCNDATILGIGSREVVARCREQRRGNRQSPCCYALVPLDNTGQKFYPFFWVSLNLGFSTNTTVVTEYLTGVLIIHQCGVVK